MNKVQNNKFKQKKFGRHSDTNQDGNNIIIPNILNILKKVSKDISLCILFNVIVISILRTSKNTTILITSIAYHTDVDISHVNSKSNTVYSYLLLSVQADKQYKSNHSQYSPNYQAHS